MGYNFDSIEVRKACLPAADGHFSARAFARMCGALANGGGVDGTRIISKERIPLMSALQDEGPAFEICELIRNELGVNE